MIASSDSLARNHNPWENCIRKAVGKMWLWISTIARSLNVSGQGQKWYFVDVSNIDIYLLSTANAN